MPTHEARAIEMSVRDRSLGEQAADGVDDGGHGLVLGEGGDGPGMVGGDECGADEGQEDERIGEGAGAVSGWR